MYTQSNIETIQGDYYLLGSLGSLLYQVVPKSKETNRLWWFSSSNFTQLCAGEMTKYKKLR